MKSLIAALRRVNVLVGTDAESTQCFRLGCSCEGIERQITVLSLCQQCVHNLVALLLQFLFSNVLHSCHLAQCLVCVGQCSLHLLCCLTSL